MISWFQCDDHKREHRLKFEQPRRLVHVSKNVVQLIQEYKNMYYLISKTQIIKYVLHLKIVIYMQYTWASCTLLSCLI